MSAKSINWSYKPDKSLSVFPSNEGESQYEAYQSIFSAIMSANRPPRTTQAQINEMSPYELLCFQKNILLMSGVPTSKEKEGKIIIYFKPRKVTHYIACRDGQTYDPYTNYQAQRTQGFCQMFAYFLAINETSKFTKVVQIDKIDILNFDKLAKNTQECARKSLEILDKNPEVYKKFKEDFDILMKEPIERITKGIRKNTTITEYITEFKTLNDNISAVKHYIYDQPLLGWRTKNKQRLWDSYMEVDKHDNWISRNNKSNKRQRINNGSGLYRRKKNKIRKSIKKHKTRKRRYKK